MQIFVEVGSFGVAEEEVGSFEFVDLYGDGLAGDFDGVELCLLGVGRTLLLLLRFHCFREDDLFIIHT